MDFVMLGVPLAAAFATSSDEEGELNRGQYWGQGPHHLKWACWVQPGKFPGVTRPFQVPEDTIITRISGGNILEYSQWRVCSEAVFDRG